MIMTIEDKMNKFIDRYASGDIIYNRVARNFFGENTSIAINGLLITHKIREDKLYRCPKCMCVVETDVINDENRNTYYCTCYNCDYSDYDYKFIQEVCFIKE